MPTDPENSHSAGPHARQDAGVPARDHERTDVSARFLSGFALGIFVIVALFMLAMYALYHGLAVLQPRSELPATHLVSTLPQQPPEPRLQQKPAIDLTAVREEERRVLENYGWVQRNAGVVHIPIERAMELVVQRGLPARKPQEQPSSPEKSGARGVR